jgi:copper transporter 1
MLWNWDTIDACFLTRSWRVRSAAGFAGTCIFVALLVLALEALRRVSHEYDGNLARRPLAPRAASPAASPAGAAGAGKAERAADDDDGAGGETASGAGAADPATPERSPAPAAAALSAAGRALSATVGGVPRAFRDDPAATAVRALLHTCQFVVAYFVMLLAMYYNGYVLISIFVGAFLGSFLFGRGPVARDGDGHVEEEATYCCG